MDLDTELRIAVKKLLNELSQCQNTDSSEKLVDILTSVGVLATVAENETEVEKWIQRNDAFSSLRKFHVLQLKKCFQTTHFARVISIIFENVCPEWFTGTLRFQTSDRLARIITNAPPCLVFLTLSATINKSRTDSIRGFFLERLKIFLQSDRLTQVLWDQCQILGRTTEPGNSRTKDPGALVLWEELINALSSLPDKLANESNIRNSDFFLPGSYIPNLGGKLLEVLGKVHDCLQSCTDCSLEFVSRLFGRLCCKGHAGELWKAVLPTLWRKVEGDYVWCRLCERLVTSPSPGSLEAMLVPLIRTLPWYGLMEKFLGDSVKRNSQIRNLLSTKMLFHKCYDDDLTLQNIIGYLASAPSRNDIYVKVLLSVLEVWSDANALKHSDYPQHLYITRTLVVCFSHFSKTHRQQCQGEVLRLLMYGVNTHLSNSSAAVRRLGMVIGEVVTAAIPFHDSEPLKFEYDTDEEVANLKSLLTVPSKPELQELEETFGAMEIEGGSKSSEKPPLPPLLEPEVVTEPSPPASDLDSDDDLEPYDMSNDAKTVDIEPPKFIRDCMQGLLCSDNPAKVEICLKAAPSLIKTSMDDVDGLAEEMCKILLHLPDSEEVGELRHVAMVTLAVRSPGPVADYLCGEFYAVNYNLRQRMDMLEVLTAAARELSTPINPSSSEEITPARVVEVLAEGQKEEHWRSVVQKRIDSKTRRFASASSKAPTGTPNRFAPVAGRFFFPLLKFYDRKENMFDLLGQDTLMLVRLIMTLAHIAQAAVHAPIARQMAQSLLEFIWILRFHSDLTVRHAVLYAVCSLVLLMPGHVFLFDLNQEFQELKLWLEDVVAKDADHHCRLIANNAWLLLNESMKEEMKSLAGSS